MPAKTARSDGDDVLIEFWEGSMSGIMIQILLGDNLAILSSLKPTIFLWDS